MTERVQVVIVGGGPAGLLLALQCERANIETVVLERRSREYVLARIRAGVLEQGFVEQLRELGLAKRLDDQGFEHAGVNLAFSNRLQRIDFAKCIGGKVTVYGQSEITRDLYEACASRGVKVINDAEDVALHDIHSQTARVSFSAGGKARTYRCDFIAGCDGFHGVCRQAIDAGAMREYERVYPFGWLGVLAQAPPVRDELVYAHHPRGFALCSMRSQKLSRYYIQCEPDVDPEAWSDEDFWDELRRRLPAEVADDLAVGKTVEKSIAPLRSYVAEPISSGKLFLAGDAAHIVPPTGAKGLNLAASDINYLAEALRGFYVRGDRSGMAGYSRKALARVWQAVRFSWWMTGLMHTFPDEGKYAAKLRTAELEYLAQSDNAQKVFAENYVGMPY